DGARAVRRRGRDHRWRCRRNCRPHHPCPRDRRDAGCVGVLHRVRPGHHAGRGGARRGHRFWSRPGPRFGVLTAQRAKAPGVVKAVLVALAVALLMLGTDRAAVTADTNPNDPQQQIAVIDQIRAQLGSNLADAMAAQQQLKKSLDDNAAQQQDVQTKITAAEDKIATLDSEIQDARLREADLTLRIDTERAQLRELARAIYVAPSSVLVILGEAQRLSDLLTRISDLNVAGSRASELKSSLANDLTDLQGQRKREQAARDEQVTQRDQLSTELAQLVVL